MRSFIEIAALSAVAILCAPIADAQTGSTTGTPVLAKTLLPAKMGTKLSVTSSSIRADATLDDRYTQNGANKSPDIEWSKGPAGTVSYVVLAADASVNRPTPIVHWIVYNIPSGKRELTPGLPSTPTLDDGAAQGKNISGNSGYMGPKPPTGQTHAYHFQVFALNSKLDVDPAKADRETVLSAMKNRVLASGDIVANYTGK
jgi:Raf kinase inhibitor-like YbhB/YbcL family protein